MRFYLLNRKMDSKQIEYKCLLLMIFQCSAARFTLKNHQNLEENEENPWFDLRST